MYTQPIVPTISDNDEQAMARLKSWLQDEFINLSNTFNSPGSLRLSAVLYGATEPTVITTSYTPLTNYAQGGMTGNFSSAGGSFDQTTGTIILSGSGSGFYSVSGLVNFSGISTKDVAARFYLDSKDIGLVLLQSGFINNKQNYLSLQASISMPLNAGDELTVGVAHDVVASGLTIVTSMFMVEQLI